VACSYYGEATGISLTPQTFQTPSSSRASRNVSTDRPCLRQVCTTLNKSARQTDPSSETPPTLRLVTAKRSDRSAWLLSGGTSGWSNITTVRFCLVVIAVTPPSYPARLIHFWMLWFNRNLNPEAQVAYYHIADAGQTLHRLSLKGLPQDGIVAMT